MHSSLRLLLIIKYFCVLIKEKYLTYFSDAHIQKKNEINILNGTKSNSKFGFKKSNKEK